MKWIKYYWSLEFLDIGKPQRSYKKLNAAFKGGNMGVIAPSKPKSLWRSVIKQRIQAVIMRVL